ncbi:MAG: DUF6492 family protein [Pirellulaceae bacterium]|nr:DUF6492 family protein [Pirellulaceae bacterium]
MLEAVLPLVRRDLDRFRILERSIAANFSSLQTCWVVVPDGEWGELAAAIKHPRYRVVPETEIAPELARCRAKGWYKQQLVKLAVAEHVESEFYLLFDADVICARPITQRDLLQDGKALCHRYQGDRHANWYRYAERVLRAKRSGWVHGVTPMILARRGVFELAAYIEGFRPRPAPWWKEAVELARGWLRPPTDLNWRRTLLASLPWTEYALYFSFLEFAGRFEQYHAHSDVSLCGQSIWKNCSFANWRPSRDVASQRPFLVVQSIAKIPPQQVMERVEHLFAA